MLGKQLNQLCTVIDKLSDVARLDDEVHVVDSPHTSMIAIRSRDGSPVFGVVGNDGMGVNVHNILKLKIDKAEILQPYIDNNGLMFGLTNEASKYENQIVDNLLRPRLPDFDPPFESGPLDLKAFIAGIEQISNIADTFHISVNDGEIRLISHGRDEVSISKRVGKVDRINMYDSKYGVELVKPILKLLGGDVIIRMGSDTCLEIRWCDEWYEYKFLVAPRIEA